jgi:hypothetical protein
MNYLEFNTDPAFTLVVCHMALNVQVRYAGLDPLSSTG